MHSLVSALALMDIACIRLMDITDKVLYNFIKLFSHGDRPVAFDFCTGGVYEFLRHRVGLHPYGCI